MINFKYPVNVGFDAETGAPVLGFEHDYMFIFDPFRSSCGRFQIDPVQEYGIPHNQAEFLIQLNEYLSTAANEAICEGCGLLQNFLETDGDFAAHHFAEGSSQSNGITRIFAEYVAAEINMARKEGE